MRRVTGLVLVKESGEGVPNVVVAMFDSELVIADIHRQGLSPGLLRNLGRRIASVLTDSSGRFSLSAADLAFEGNESRPDLLLMVLAPEDVQDVKRPFPLPVEERTLYISTVPRSDAGAEEAYVIRLLRAQLDRFGIITGHGDRDQKNAADDVTSPALRALEIRDAAHALLAERRAAAQKEIDDARTMAKSLLAGFSAVPQRRRDETLANTSNMIVGKASLAEQLPQMQRASAQAAIKRLRGSANSPSMRLHLSEDEVVALGLKITRGSISGVVTAKALSEKVKALVDVTDMKRTLNTQSPSLDQLDELERRYLWPPTERPDPQLGSSKKARGTS